MLAHDEALGAIMNSARHPANAAELLNPRSHPEPATERRGGALVGMEFGFMGPNYSISTACATANYCFVAAANHIRNGEADMILAGGSEAPIIPVGLGGFVACRRAAPWPRFRSAISGATGTEDTKQLPCEPVG